LYWLSVLYKTLMFIDHTATVQKSFNCFETIELLRLVDSDDTNCTLLWAEQTVVWQGELLHFTYENHTD
jgi:hypothetical protein